MKLYPALRLRLGLLSGLVLMSAGVLTAQDPDPNAPLSPQQAEQLLGPIALYPDALIALILPASTMPGDIVMAARYLNTGGDIDKVEFQPWDESIKALTRYPVLIKWLDDNLPWTQQLGRTFQNQPDDVMDAVQRLRVRARASGALVSTPQQKVLLDGDVIRIVPARPDEIYVPYYDPDVVFVDPPYNYGVPWVTFGVGFRIGIWLSYDCDWHGRTIWVGDRHHNWKEHGDWDHHYESAGRPNNANWHQWKAPAGHQPYAHPDSHRAGSDLSRPGALPGAPTYPRHQSPPKTAAPTRPDSRHDSDQGHPSSPNGNAPSWQNSPDNHGHNDRPATPPVTPNPTAKPAPVNPPHQDSDHRGHNDRPPPAPSGPSNPGPKPPPPPSPAPNRSQPAPPRPDNPAPPVPNHPDQRDHAGPPPSHPDQRDHSGPVPNNPPSNRPEPRPDVTLAPRQVNPPPTRQVAPPPPTKDGTRDNQPEVQR